MSDPEFDEYEYLFTEQRRLLNIATSESKKRKKAEFSVKSLKEEVTKAEEEVAKREKGFYRMQAYFETQMERMRGFLNEQDRVIGEQTEVAVNLMEIARDHQARYERLRDRAERENPTCCVCMVHVPDNMVNPCGSCVNGHICLACFCRWNRTAIGTTNCPTCNQAYPDEIQTTPDRPRQARLIWEGDIRTPATQPPSPEPVADMGAAAREEGLIDMTMSPRGEENVREAMLPEARPMPGPLVFPDGSQLPARQLFRARRRQEEFLRLNQPDSDVEWVPGDD